jgi:hypothetical protein
LTLAPALLRASGRAVFWPFGVRSRRAGEPEPREVDEQAANRFWEWASRVITARPGLILAVCLLLLAPLAWRGLSVELTYDFLSELEPNSPSVQGAQLAKRHFPAGEMAPITVLALKRDAHFNQPDGEREIGRLTKRFYELEGISAVRSMAEPTGDTPGYFQPFRSSGLKKLAARRHKITKSRFLTPVPELIGDVARFDLIFLDEPFSPQALRTLDRVEQFLDRLRDQPGSPWQGTKFAYVGTTVATVG